jgi:hypothetical protein
MMRKPYVFLMCSAALFTGILIGQFLWHGRVEEGRAGPTPTTLRGDADAMIDLPPKEFVVLRRKGHEYPQVNIFQRTEKRDMISSAAIFTGGAKGSAVYSSFHESTAAPKKLSVQVGGIHVGIWRFREDGSIESCTTFPKKGGFGTRRNFDTDGNVTGEQHEAISHGS